MKNIIAEKVLTFDQSFAFNNTTHRSSSLRNSLGRWVKVLIRVMEAISLNNDH